MMVDEATTETAQAQPSQSTALIDTGAHIERRALIGVSSELGGVRIENMMQLIEFAKVMSMSGPMVPGYLRNNPGACAAICLQSMEWRFSPFFVANKSYAVENKGEVRIGYESQLIHAVIEARAPIKFRLAVAYEGEGDERRCIVSGIFRGETEPRIFKSETLGRRRPENNQYGQPKGSPLWKTKPDLQQFYDTSRDWARMYCPDILGGVYSKDELEEMGPDNARDITPPAKIASGSLIERLNGAPKQVDGFDVAHVERTLGGEKTDKKPKSEEQQESRLADQKNRDSAAARDKAPNPPSEAKSDAAAPREPEASEGRVSDHGADATVGQGGDAKADKAAAEVRGSPQTSSQDSAATSTEPVRPQDWWLGHGDDAAARGTEVLEVFLRTATPEKPFRDKTIANWRKAAVEADKQIAAEAGGG